MSVETEFDNGIVILTLRGSITEADALHGQSEAAAMLKEKGTLLLLVDIRDANVDASIPGMFEVNASHPRAFPPATRHAVVYHRNASKKEREKMYFAETVAVNRGAIMEYFDDFTKAKQWLEKEAAE